MSAFRGQNSAEFTATGTTLAPVLTASRAPPLRRGFARLNQELSDAEVAEDMADRHQRHRHREDPDLLRRQQLRERRHRTDPVLHRRLHLTERRPQRIEVRPAAPWSIAVPMASQLIGSTRSAHGLPPEPTGIDQLGVGRNFIIRPAHG